MELEPTPNSLSKVIKTPAFSGYDHAKPGRPLTSSKDTGKKSVTEEKQGRGHSHLTGAHEHSHQIPQSRHMLHPLLPMQSDV